MSDPDYIKAAKTVEDLISEMRVRAEKAEAEADRLHEALTHIAWSVADADPQAMREFARTTLYGEEGGGRA